MDTESKPTWDDGEGFKAGDVTKTEPPAGTEGGTWYRYEITQGTNRITGYRQGSKASVMRSVAEHVERLNERRVGKPGRVHLTPSPKKRA